MFTRSAIFVGLVGYAAAFAGMAPMSLQASSRRASMQLRAGPSMKIGIFYGTSTGNTESVATRVRVQLISAGGFSTRAPLSERDKSYEAANNGVKWFFWYTLHVHSPCSLSVVTLLSNMLVMWQLATALGAAIVEDIGSIEPAQLATYDTCKSKNSLLVFGTVLALCSTFLTLHFCVQWSLVPQLGTPVKIRNVLAQTGTPWSTLISRRWISLARRYATFEMQC